MGNAHNSTQLLNNELVITAFRKLKHSSNSHASEDPQITRNRRRHPHQQRQPGSGNNNGGIDGPLDADNLLPAAVNADAAAVGGVVATASADHVLPDIHLSHQQQRIHHTAPRISAHIHSHSNSRGHSRICANQLLLNDAARSSGRELTGVVVESPVLSLGAIFFMLRDLLGHLVIVAVHNLHSKREEHQFFEGLCLTVKDPTFEDGLMESVSLVKVQDPHLQLLLHGPATAVNASTIDAVGGSSSNSQQPQRLQGVLPVSAVDWYTLGNEFFRAAEDARQLRALHHSSSNDSSKSSIAAAMQNGCQCLDNAIRLVLQCAAAAVLSNRAAALMNAALPIGAVRDCAVLLHLQPNNARVLQRLVEALKATDSLLQQQQLLTVATQLLAGGAEHKIHIHEKAVAEAHLLEHRHAVATHLLDSLWWEEHAAVISSLHEHVPGFDFQQALLLHPQNNRTANLIAASSGSHHNNSNSDGHNPYAHQRLEPLPIDSAAVTVTAEGGGSGIRSPQRSPQQSPRRLQQLSPRPAQRSRSRSPPRVAIVSGGGGGKLQQMQRSMLQDLRGENAYIQQQHALGHHNVLPSLVRANINSSDSDQRDGDQSNMNHQHDQQQQQQEKTYRNWHEDARRAFKLRDFSGAAELFTAALSACAQERHCDYSATAREYLCHRSTKLFAAEDFVGSLLDATCACVLDSSCPVGWYRRALALQKLQRGALALASARAGLAAVNARQSRYGDLRVEVARLEATLISELRQQQELGRDNRQSTATATVGACTIGSSTTIAAAETVVATTVASQASAPLIAK